MDAKYYDIKNIDRRAKEYLEEVACFRNSHEWEIKEGTTALLVIDMQKYFLDKKSHAEIPSARAIVPKIKKLQEEFLKFDYPVIQTRHINNSRNSGMMDKWWADVITEDDPMSELDSDLTVNKIEILKKFQYDAFFGTELENMLRSKGIEQVIITGVATHLCCETTARSAFMRGFKVLFALDCVATFAENFHRATILNLAHGFAIPVLSGEILDKLETQT